MTNPASLGGGVFTRDGQRVREFTVGYDTIDLHDNEFSITGNWITTMPNGHTHSTTITVPVLIKFICMPNSSVRASGTLSITKNNGTTAILDYGDGACDNLATLTINGVVHNIILGN